MMPGGMLELPLRCSVIKTSNALILISPVEFDQSQLSRIRELGDVTDIVAPSELHHTYVEQAIRHFPRATIWAAPGLEKKRPGIRWNKIFGRDPWPYETEVKALVIEGLVGATEVAFLEVSTRTLIVVDLVFNLQRPRGWAAPILLRLFGTYKRFAVSRLFIRSLANRSAFESSMRTLMMEWKFDRVVMAHGEVVEFDGHTMLRQALAVRGFTFVSV